MVAWVQGTLCMSEEQAQLMQQSPRCSSCPGLFVCPEAVSGLERCSLQPARRLAGTCLLLGRDESGEIPARSQLLTLIC